MLFLEKIKNICNKNERVAMFIDMDGTIVEYNVYDEKNIAEQMANEYDTMEPLNCVLEVLKEVNKIPNIDLHIVTLSKSNKVTLAKMQWLNKYASFIDEKNWIIIDKEKGEYNKENRDVIKVTKICEHLQQYNHVILLDDDHKILRTSKDHLKDKINVYHISSAII